MDSDRRQTLKSRAQAFFDGPKYRPIESSSLADRLEVRKSELGEFPDLLHELEGEGIAVHVDGRGWCSPRREGWVTGILTVNQRGFGFVRPVREDPKGDIYIPPRKLKDGHDGDLVLARVRKPRRGARRPSKGGGREGAVLHVVRRSTRIITGVYYRGAGDTGVVEPLRHESVREIHIAPGREREARDGDRVLARLRDEPTVGGCPPGEVVEIAAPEGTWRADLQVIASEYGLREEFPAEVMSEVKSQPDAIPPEALAGREDLRDVLTFTIDPRDAKDHDDAVTLEERPDGSWCLGVLIADVSHFVRPGTALDREAYRRGTSVYLPGRTYPMLPPRLSDDICSLDEGKDRLCKALWMDISPDGDLIESRLERGVMRCARGFSYQEAQEYLDGGKARAGEKRLVAMLHAMNRLRQRLYQKRLDRGSLDLELPEQRILLDDDGEVLDIGPQRRLEAHRLIEEFMLIANQGVALLATAKKLPILRRVHPAPPEEDVEAFLRFCRVLIPGIPVHSADDFQHLVTALEGNPLAPIINLALLRTLTRAEYLAEKSRHYALGTDEYCHFTSPIRRYPDLQVHRALDVAFFGDRPRAPRGVTSPELEQMAEHVTATERSAEEAEREMSRLRAISWLRQFEGDEFTGIITAVLDSGFFVRLEPSLTEGMVHITSLRDDYYVLHESRFTLRGRNTGKSFRIGDRIAVVLHRADSVSRQVDLRYVGHRKQKGSKRS